MVRLTRLSNKLLAGGLSFIGNLVSVFSGGAHLFIQNFTATLTPTALLTKKIIDSGFVATFSFVGTFSKSFVFVRNFLATLSFNIAPGGAFTRILTIDHTLVPSTQTDFPVLVSITDATLKQ